MPRPLESGLDRRLGPVLAEINVIPFVDIVLVLLIIFMVTAPMMLSGIDVKVPRSETRNIDPEERLVLTVTKNHEVYLGDQPITLDKLGQVLKGLQQRSPQAAVFLKADQAAAYGMVVRVMDVVKKAGIDRLGMVTEPLFPTNGGG